MNQASSIANTPAIPTTKIFIEPDDGIGIITQAIASAQKSISLEIYMLNDRRVISALIDAKNATPALNVRVILDPQPYGVQWQAQTPDQTMAQLQQAGIQAQAGCFHYTHIKMMLIDSELASQGLGSACITSANFTEAALGGYQPAHSWFSNAASHLFHSSSRRPSTNREYGIITNDPTIIQTAQSIFEADWQSSSTTPSIASPILVVSPEMTAFDNSGNPVTSGNARTQITTLLQSAQNSVLIEMEDISDGHLQDTLNALAAKASASNPQQTIQVQIILPNFTSASSIDQTIVQLAQSTTLYMHAKMILVDGQTAFIGSQNLSRDALETNREIGIITNEAHIIAALQKTFAQDWQNATSSQPPANS